MRLPFTHHLCFYTPAPANLISSLLLRLGAGPAVLNRKADCPQMSSTTAYIPRQKAFIIVVSPGYLPDFRAKQTT